MKTNIPKLRFIEFKDDPAWEKTKLGDVCLSKSSNVTNDEVAPSGKYVVYGANDVVGFLESFSCSNYISIVKDGAGVGRLALVRDESSVLSTMQYIIPKDVDIKFLYYLMEKMDFTIYKTGSTIPHIYFRDYSLHNILVPLELEQEQVGAFLYTLDRRIELQEKLIEKLEEEKKGYLQKLFPKKGANIPELRFHEFENSIKWDKKKLNDICVCESSSITNNEVLSVGKYAVYGANNVVGYLNTYKHENYISILKDGAGVGRIELISNKSSVLATMQYIVPTGINVAFLYYLMQKIDFTSYKVGSTIPHIYFRDYSTESVIFPDKSEQEKIAKYFLFLDNNICLQRDLHTKLITKKAFLLNELLI